MLSPVESVVIRYVVRSVDGSTRCGAGNIVALKVAGEAAEIGKRNDVPRFEVVSVAAFIRLAMIRIMLRRLTRSA
jgi:hypothetical protein